MRVIASLLPFALAIVLSVPAFAQEIPMSSELARHGTVSVSGHGEIAAKPDMATVTSGVTSEGSTAREALDANTRDMAALIAAIKSAGIEPKDIQTSGFSVSPNYIYSDQKDANGYTLPPKISGYQVTNSVTIRVRDLAGLGQVLDRSVTVGANTISGISFSVADPAKLYEQARKAAFGDAKAKATLYAGEAQEGIGPVISISEAQDVTPPRPYAERQYSMAAPASAPVPVESGELTFSIDVQVTWGLDGKPTGAPPVAQQQLPIAN